MTLDDRKERTMNMQSNRQAIKVVGIDLAKSSFQLHGIDADGCKVLNKRLGRSKLKEFMVNLPPCLVAMEACGSAHYWGRLFQSHGHQVKLIAPQFVKPFLKSNKNDALDAEAITEAVQRPNMRFVAIKERAQQDIQAIHRMRSMAVGRRNAQIQQIRGLLLEFGIAIPKGKYCLEREIPSILEDADNGLSNLFREELADLYAELKRQDQRVLHYDQRIEEFVQKDERAQRLLTIPGIGPIGATALLAAIGDVNMFKNGRELAAWLGLVPRQSSTGGKNTLLGISKRGDAYIRTTLIHGARAALQRIEQKNDRVSQWATALKKRCHANVLSVAMANKMARTAYALLKHDENYKVELSVSR
jgi:transposase